MYIPLQGSGATNATILGRLFGMRAQTMFWIITAGSIISTLSVVSCVTAVAKLWQISPRLAIFAILVIATAIIAVVLVWRKRTKRFSPEKPACSCGSNEEDIFS
jgi:multisubunit Na+/H+ antiporter MnhB subunit